MNDDFNILLTGATGFVGKNLTPVLKREYKDIYALVRETSEIGFLKDLGVKLKFGDLTDKTSLQSLRDIKVDIVIHLAAIMADKDYLSESAFLKVNSIGTQNLLESMGRNIQQFIHISTTGVYGPTDELGFDESTSYGERLSNYERSKIESEKVVLRFCKENNLAFTILRFGQLYGPLMTYGWEEIVERILKGKMFIIGKGDNLIHLTSIIDAVGALMMTIGNGRCRNQIFNICARKPSLVKEVFYTIARLLNKPLPKHTPFLPVYMAACLLDRIPYDFKPRALKYLTVHRLHFFSHHHVYKIDKARDYFGYNPATELSQGLSEMISWYLKTKREK